MTVADDLAGLTRRHHDMQVMVWDIENNTERERYCVNPIRVATYFTSASALVIYVSKLPLGACSIRACSISKLRERSGSVVECLTPDRRAAGSSLTGVTALWSLSKTHLS